MAWNGRSSCASFIRRLVASPTIRKPRHEKTVPHRHRPRSCSGRDRHRIGAGFPVTPDHAGRAVSGRRTVGHLGAHPGRVDAEPARPAHHHRERERRRRRHRGRPRRARGARRLHAQPRPCADACHQCRHPDPAIRRGEGFRAGVAHRRHAAVDRGEKHVSGEGPDRNDGLDEGEPGQGDGRGGRRRWPDRHRRHLLPEAHRHQLPAACPIAAALRSSRIWSPARST